MSVLMLSTVAIKFSSPPRAWAASMTGTCAALASDPPVAVLAGAPKTAPATVVMGCVVAVSDGPTAVVGAGAGAGGADGIGAMTIGVRVATAVAVAVWTEARVDGAAAGRCTHEYPTTVTKATTGTATEMINLLFMLDGTDAGEWLAPQLLRDILIA